MQICLDCCFSYRPATTKLRQFLRICHFHSKHKIATPPIYNTRRVRPAAAVSTKQPVGCATTASLFTIPLLSSRREQEQRQQQQWNLSMPPSVMNRKRVVSSSGVGSGAAPSASKKRKTDNVQKYYAVQVGFRPGVYMTYAECAQQTAGFKGALFRSFVSRSDAEAFVAGEKVNAPSEGPAKFYAVAVGNPTGIFNEWEDAAEAIKGVKGPKYKRFGSREEAVEYIREYGSLDAILALGEGAISTVKTTSSTPLLELPTQVKKPQSSKTTRAAAAAAAATASSSPLAMPLVKDDVLRVYTDGSSLANGKAGARAGVGVFFGPGDARNISERLVGEPQTNQRAELMAMLRALQVCPLGVTVRIVSDSQYSINCVTQWASSWKKKGWVTATGEPVKNQDIIRTVLDRMEERARAGAATHFEWVKGHATDRGNEAADALAVRGAKM